MSSRKFKKYSTDPKLREVQLAELKIVDEIVRICDMENITYYISGGTFIGAVRHGGFIPWDDDADIAMPRDQFERFMEVAPKFLKKNFELKYYKNDGKFPYYIPKVVDKTVKLVDHSSTKEKIIPCWVDIFPLDGMPKSKIAFKLHAFRLLADRALINLSDFDNVVKVNKSGRPLLEKIIIFFGRHVKAFSKIDSHKRMDKITKDLKKYPASKSLSYVNFMGAYKLNSVISKRIYGKGAYYEFEGRSLFGPKDYDSYLTHIYGDYMSIPPQDKRNKHFTEVL